MPEVRPFRGIRFNAIHQPNLGGVIAPPYDTVDPDAATSPISIAALENVHLNGGADAHRTAAHRYEAWRSDGTLIADDRAALYVHDQEFTVGEERRRRRGLLARVRLAPWSTGGIVPHERVVSGPRDERLARLRAVRANLSPLYLLYQDADAAVRDVGEVALAGQAPVATGTDAHGGEHRLYALTAPAVQDQIAHLLASRPLFVADGHHRYEAALAYRDCLAKRGDLASDDPANFVLAMLAPVDDPGVIVRPTHRVVTGGPHRTAEQVRAALAPVFDVLAEVPPGETRLPICRLIVQGDDTTWHVLPRADRPDQHLLPAGYGETWRRLDVVIGDHVILEALLGVRAGDGGSDVWYTPDEEVARLAVVAGNARLALLYDPPSLPALVAVATAGDILPPKSTFFDPKPPAGLVVSDHRLP